MPPLGELAHDLGRLRTIVAVMARHGFAPTLRRIPGLKAAVRAADIEVSSTPPAERFCQMLEELGPTFVKLGQILSTRADVLPPSFIASLSRLQDQVPAFPFAAVEQQIAAAFGKPIDALFATFDRTPLASASMAQVHAATLHTGEEVVVKVQRPLIAEQVRADASILVLLAQLLERVIEEASQYRATDLAKEFEYGLTAELDFTLEAQNLTAFGNFNRGRMGVHVPRLYPDLSTRTVLTMERIRGRRITDRGADDAISDPHEIIERLVMVSFEQLFVDGMFHGDPHPGNVLVTDTGDLAFIDFGLMGRVARDVQDRMLILLIALSLRDADTCARILVRMGDPDERVSLVHFRDAIARLLDTYLGLSVSEVNTSAALADLLDLSTRFGVRLPRELALLSKASISIDGIVRSLHPDFNPSDSLTKRAQELLVERFDPREWKTGGLRSALQVGMLLQELPLQLSQVLLDLERGQLQVSIRSPDLELLDLNLRGLGMTIFGGLVASASLLGGFYVLAKQDWALFGIPLLPAVAFSVAGTAFGIAFTWYLTGGRLKKIPISRLIGKFLGRAK